VNICTFPLNNNLRHEHSTNLRPCLNFTGTSPVMAVEPDNVQWTCQEDGKDGNRPTRGSVYRTSIASYVGPVAHLDWKTSSE
jgi:hypothetical protein